MNKFDKIDRSRREDADRFFKQQMSNADGYGRMADDARRQGKMGEVAHYEEKVKDAQKQMRKVVDFKMSDNRKKDRSYMDGYEL